MVASGKLCLAQGSVRLPRGRKGPLPGEKNPDESPQNKSEIPEYFREGQPPAHDVSRRRSFLSDGHAAEFCTHARRIACRITKSSTAPMMAVTSWPAKSGITCTPRRVNRKPPSTAP